MIAHFFDIDVILQSDSKVWIVDKNSPNIPILKISKSDFNLIRSGIYKNQNNSISLGGHEYWIPTDLMSRIKIKAKNYSVDFSNLGFSMQEFMNKEVIDNVDYNLNMSNILHLKNTDDHIYIICSKNSKKNYDTIITKIEKKLEDNGLKIKKYYFISETFFNRNDDDISYKKVRLILQHLVGFKTEEDKFTDEELESYDEIFFYDDEYSTNLAKSSNLLIKKLIDNTSQELKERIKNLLKEKEHILTINLATNNLVNKFIKTRLIVDYSNLIKTFEGFKFKN